MTSVLVNNAVDNPLSWGWFLEKRKCHLIKTCMRILEELSSPKPLGHSVTIAIITTCILLRVVVDKLCIRNYDKLGFFIN